MASTTNPPHARGGDQSSVTQVEWHESPPMTRVLIVQPVIPGYCVPLFDALAALSGLDVRVIASPRTPGLPASVKGLPSWADVHHSCKEFFGGRVFWQRGMAIPSSWRPGDVVCVNGEPRFLSNLPLLWNARRRGLGIIWWGHGWSSTSVEWRARIRTVMMRVADVVLLYTDREAREFQKRVGAATPIIGLNNTLDSRPIREAVKEWPAERLAAFRETHGLNSGALLLFCGRLRESPPTELEVGFGALARLAQRHPDVRFVIIGDGEQKPFLQSLATRLGVGDRVIWVGPLFEERQLAPWFLSATVFVYPGTVGLSLLHALSYGLPVITHGELKKQAPEIAALHDGVNGYTFPRGDAECLGTLIELVITNPDLRKSLSEQALRTVQDEFSFGQMVDRFARGIAIASQISRVRTRIT